MNGPLLSVRDLRVHFPVKGRQAVVKAVDGISFDVMPGETVSLVGESGCGKTTTGRAILRLQPATSGQVQWEGTDLLQLSPQEMRRFRRKLQIVFQDPYASLNPRMTVGETLAEALAVQQIGDRHDRRERVRALLGQVGLRAEYEHRYPHEFSGGQRQRIGVARALSVEPSLIVCDEPVSALDVSVQAQVINLLSDLQQALGISYLFIAHDLSVVKHISDQVVVMYLGKVVERGPVDQLFAAADHPYTQALLAAIPVPDPDRSVELAVLRGELPSPLNPPSGCRFHPRCPVAASRCQEQEPELRQITADHLVACHLTDPQFAVGAGGERRCGS